MNNSSNIQTIPSDPTVILTALHSGEVVYQAKVGDGPLGMLLSDLHKNSSTPLDKQEYQIDTVGQEIYNTTDKDFIFAIRGCFTALRWPEAKNLPKLFASVGLTFAFVISY